MRGILILICLVFQQISSTPLTEEKFKLILNQFKAEIKTEISDILIARLNCGNDESEQKYVLITGDQLSTDTTFSENSQDMEIMNKDGTTKLCSAKSKYPLKVVDAAGAMVGETMVICGGGYPLTPDCYEYCEVDKAWKKLSSMQTARNDAKAVALDGALWVTGGDDRKYDALKSTEIMYLNGTVKAGPELPEAISGHCIAQYESKTFFIWSDNVWEIDNVDINNLNGIQWKVGPKYNIKRRASGCGIVKSDAHGGRPLLVVAGGRDGNAKKTSEYLDFTLPSPTWKLLSKEIPKRTYGYEEYLKYGPMINPTLDGKGLLMAHYHDIYKWQCKSVENCFWTYEDGYKPKIGRKGGIFLTAPNSLVKDC